ncbi:MAG: insulinase family protein [Planctomycetes bacterium]|nr:insulinase family protein [Planctomycetota bacterium]
MQAPPLFQRFALGNGIPLFVRESQRFKTTIVRLHIHHPLGADATETALVPFVLRSGCRRHPTFRRIVQFLEGLYGASLAVDVLKVGERQILAFQVEVLGDRFVPRGSGTVEKALAFLERLVVHPVLSGGALGVPAVVREKENLRRLIASLIDDKLAYAVERCHQVMFADEPYRLYEYGELDRISSLQAGPLTEHHRDILERDPMELYVSGDVRAHRVAAAAARLFRFRRSTPRPIPPTVVDRPVRKERTVVEEADVEQGKLLLGYRTYTTLAHADYYPLVFLNGLFGGFAHSRLFRVFREEEGLAYAAGSSLERTKGLLEVDAGIEGDDYEEAVASIRRQVEDLRAGNVTDEEMEWTRKALEDVVRGLPDSPVAEIVRHAELALHGREETHEEALERIRAVTRDEVVRVARRIQLDTVYFLRPKPAN